jgi:hypothetical protein
MTVKQRKDINQMIGYAVKEGCLDDYEAIHMTYKQKQDWLDRSEAQAEAICDALREEECLE